MDLTPCSWILQYIRLYGSKTHPALLVKNAVECFLSHLTTERHVSAATQKQILGSNLKS